MWLVYAVIGSVIWGLDYVLSEKIFAYKISPITLSALQTMIGAMVFITLGALKYTKNDINIIWHNKKVLLITMVTIISFNIANLLIFFSIREKNAALTGLIELTYPLFILLFAWLLFAKSYCNWTTLIGGLLIFSGAALISYFNLS